MPASFPLCQRKTFFHHFSLFSLFSLSLSRSSRANLPGKNSEWATASSQTRPRSSSAQPGASTSRTRPEGRGSRRQACRRSMAVAASSPFTTGAPARPCGASPVGSPCRRGRSRQRYEILVALDCRSEYASLFLPAGERGKEKGSDSQSWSQKKKTRPQPRRQQKTTKTRKQLAWSHPEFGQALAVAADDGTVSIWVEEGGPRVVTAAAERKGRNTTTAGRPRFWQQAATFESGGLGAASALAFAPAVHGPRLAVGWGDGVVRVYAARSLLLGCAVVSDAGRTATAASAPSPSFPSSSSLPLPPPAAWELESQFEASPPASPVTSLCWRPQYAGAPGEKLPPLLAVGTAARRRRRQRGGGCGGAGGENGAGPSDEGGGSGVWLFRTPLLRWTKACTLDPAGDVAAVAWAPAGSPAAPERVATATGGSVRVFALAGAADSLASAAASSGAASTSSAAVSPEAVLRHSAPVWKLEWAPLGGGWLAAGTERGAVALWRQDFRGAWAAQSAIVCDQAQQQQLEQQQQDATSGLATVVV